MKERQDPFPPLSQSHCQPLLGPPREVGVWPERVKSSSWRLYFSFHSQMLPQSPKREDTRKQVKKKNPILFLFIYFGSQHKFRAATRSQAQLPELAGTLPPSFPLSCPWSSGWRQGPISEHPMSAAESQAAHWMPRKQGCWDGVEVLQGLGLACAATSKALRLA